MEFVVGIFVGGLLFWLFFTRKKPIGTFVIDFSDPMKDVFRFDWEVDINTVYTKKYVLFKVKVIEESSQE